MARSKKYRILAPYLKWLGGRMRAEQGEIRDDLPRESIGWLSAQGLIEQIKEVEEEEQEEEQEQGGEVDGPTG